MIFINLAFTKTFLLSSELRSCQQTICKLDVSTIIHNNGQRQLILADPAVLRDQTKLRPDWVLKTGGDQPEPALWSVLTGCGNQNKHPQLGRKLAGSHQTSPPLSEPSSPEQTNWGVAYYKIHHIITYNITTYHIIWMYTWSKTLSRLWLTFYLLSPYIVSLQLHTGHRCCHSS